MKSWLSDENEFSFYWDRQFKEFGSDAVIMEFLHKEVPSIYDHNTIISRFFP